MAKRHLPTSAVRSSHSALRCGSSASDLTVLMPKIVSPSAAFFRTSALTTLAKAMRIGRRNAKIISMIKVAQTRTNQASVAFSQNNSGSRTSRVIMSSKVVISLPVMNSRTLLTWLTLYIVSPAGWRSK